MKFQTAVKLGLVGATASWREILAQEAQDRRRTMKEQAVGLVHRFLKSVQFHHKKPQAETTLASWNHVPQEKKSNGRLLPADGQVMEPAEEGRFRPSSRRMKRAKKKSTKSSTTTKSIKSGAYNDDDLMDGFFVRRRGFKSAYSGEVVTCFYGYSEDVTLACQVFAQGSCCSGNGACDWQGYATVCIDACVGRGACRNIPSGSFIGPFSCRGYRACFTVGLYSKTMRIGESSCNLGDYACSGVCGEAREDRYGNGCKVEIGNRACQGKRACSEVARFPYDTQAVSVADYSCVGNEACFGLGRFRAFDVDIHKKACIGDYACKYVARGSQAEVRIDHDSCVGKSACEDLGRTSTVFSSRFDIGSESCTNEYACQGLGSVSRYVTIEDKSCTGLESCRKLATNFFQPVHVHKEACTYDFGCYELAESVTSNDAEFVEIGRKACNDEPGQCSADLDPVCATTAVIPANADSCSG